MVRSTLAALDPCRFIRPSQSFGQQGSEAKLLDEVVAQIIKAFGVSTIATWRTAKMMQMFPALEVRAPADLLAGGKAIITRHWK